MRVIQAIVCVLFCYAIAPAVHARAGLPDFTDLVKRNHEAVVNISTRQAFDSDNADGSPDIRERMEEFLRERERRGDGDEPNPFDSRGVGSGFIISADGYIVTNNHVVDGADELVVRLHDRRQLIATVIGTDERSDIAVIKVEASNLPVVTIGDSNALEVGEWVLAIGSPFGFDFTVTAGIVSAIGRSLPTESYVPFIQTDVAINPGNSGGPLFNLDGDVVGVNAQIFSRTGSFMGLSFAIPIELAMNVVDQLRAKGTVSRGWLGVTINEVSLARAERNGMDTAHGALVRSILENSPAEASELQEGDIITHFNGSYVVSSSSLPPLVGRVPANADARVRINRNGEVREIIVNIGELPSTDDVQNRFVEQRLGSAAPFGLAVSPLSDRDRAKLDIDTGGVLVDSVDVDSPADAAGIVPGDALLTIGNMTVDSAKDLSEIAAELAEDDSPCFGVKVATFARTWNKLWRNSFIPHATD